MVKTTKFIKLANKKSIVSHILNQVIYRLNDLPLGYPPPKNILNNSSGDISPEKTQ